MELTVDKGCRKVNWCVECCPCDLVIEGNNTRYLHHHIEWNHRETKHKNGYSFVFQECIQVFSSF